MEWNVGSQNPIELLKVTVLMEGQETFPPSKLQKFRYLSVETVLFYAVVVLNFFAMQREFSCVKRARVDPLSPNQIREVVLDSDSEEDKSYTSQESEDEEQPRPPS